MRGRIYQISANLLQYIRQHPFKKTSKVTDSVLGNVIGIGVLAIINNIFIMIDLMNERIL